jgi:GDP-L-fucose synthase
MQATAAARPPRQENAMDQNSKIYVAGHRGLVGGAILRQLQAAGHEHIVTRTRQELDLTDARAVDAFFQAERPSHVFLAAAKVGGILANKDYPADFIRENLQIQTHVIDSAYRSGVTKLAFLGSSCIYPKLAQQPMQESALLSGKLEPTNDAYAIAKIAGIIMCQAYRRQYGFDAISLMPTNVYGPGDNFDLESSHVLPALIRRFHEAKQANAAQVTVWGSGTPMREFIHCDELAEACVFLMNSYSDEEIVNIGTGIDVTIRELAETVKDAVGFEGRLEWDTSKPDGTPRKLMDVSKLAALGWSSSLALKDGIAQTYAWFNEMQASGAGVRSVHARA